MTENEFMVIGLILSAALGVIMAVMLFGIMFWWFDDRKNSMRHDKTKGDQ